MKISDKVKIIEEICANGLKNPHFKKIATILEIDKLNLIKVSIDNFPNCNSREYHNRFYYTQEEVKFFEEEKDAERN